VKRRLARTGDQTSGLEAEVARFEVEIALARIARARVAPRRE
jgi:hypothetical protein